MFTIEQVKQDLIKENKSLNRTWQKVGDVNDIEYGGVRYRKGKSGDIEVILYIGKDNIPSDCKDIVSNKYISEVYLSDLIEQIEDIWSYSDVENCGLNIGWLILSLDQYSGIIRN